MASTDQLPGQLSAEQRRLNEENAPLFENSNVSIATMARQAEVRYLVELEAQRQLILRQRQKR